MRGNLLLKTLETLKECALNQADLFEAILVAGYGASGGKINYEFRKIQNAKESRKLERQELERRKKRFRNFVYQMKHDGLIEEGEHAGDYQISKRGKEKIEELKRKLPTRHYKLGGSTRLTIISFDIPEKLRNKRDWLREVIKNLNFSMVHQSVWVGKSRIPKELIEDLDSLRILDYVEIFEVTKSGSLKKI